MKCMFYFWAIPPEAGRRPALKKNLNFVFYLFRKGYKVFSPLRYENDLFMMKIMTNI